MIRRKIEISKMLKSNKALLIYGPRRVGKTTLLNEFLASTTYKYKLESGDNIRVQEILASQDFERIKDYVHGYNLIAIDEAQNIPDVGMGLKIMIDQTEGLRVIATGSSSFRLKQATGEPLTGRKTSLILYPISQSELHYSLNKHELREQLENNLIYGSYPEVILAPSKKEKISILTELAESYLLKDIFNLYQIQGSKQLISMLKLLAFQVGSLVSLNEIAMHIGMDVKTVSRYIDLLEKGFVIKSLGGYSRNQRDEVVSKSKYYFLDNGIRNAIVRSFNTADNRADIGQLFENFMIMEYWKKQENSLDYSSFYFWRNYSGKEIDLIVEKDGILDGFEFKWSRVRKNSAPASWTKSYPNSKFNIITRENYLDFLLD